MAPGWSFTPNLPDFNGNPGESWDIYEADIQLAYDGAGQAPTKDEVKRAHLLRGLKGEAATFLRLNPHLRSSSYDEVRAILRKRFTKPAWQKLGELPYLKQEFGETVKGYAERLKSTVRALSPETQFTPVIPADKKEEEAISQDTKVEAISTAQMSERTKAYHEFLDLIVFNHFLDGLRDEIKHPVKNALPSNLDEAIAIAERYEDQALMQEEFRRLNVTVAETQVDSTVKRAETQLRALNHNGISPPDNTAAGGAPSRSEARCYNCNKRGHYARNCNSRDNRDRFRRQTGQRFMERDEPPLRRQMSTMPRQTVEKQRPNENPSGKFRQDSRLQRPPRRYNDYPDSPSDSREEKRRRDKRAKSEEAGHSTWLQDRRPKNGMRPPQRGGHQQPPRPLRFKD
jgi:hypothetical protein